MAFLSRPSDLAVSETQTGCPASRVATTPVETISADRTAEHAAGRLERGGFDAAPVAGDTPTQFVTLAALHNADPETEVRDVASPITLTDTLSADAPYASVVDALRDQSVYFLGGRHGVTGIVTRADLNADVSRLHLFSRISVLEQRLRRLLVEADVTLDSLTIAPAVIEDVDDRHRKAKRANVELDRVHYAQFSTLVAAVTDVERCWSACGYDSAHHASSRLGEITDLRNDVAHATPIVQNTDSAEIGTGRTVGNLADCYTEIEAVVAELD